MRTSRRKKISTLGVIAILAGCVAWGATRHPIIGGPMLIGGYGAMLGLLALLGASLIGNTGKVVPFLGLLACASAAVFGFTHNSGGVSVSEQFRDLVRLIRPSAVSPAPKATVPARPPAASTAAQEKPVGSGTIFDMSKGGKDRAATDRPPPVPQTPGVISVPSAINGTTSIPIGPVSNAKQRYAAAYATLNKARANLDAATAALVIRLSPTPAYQSAKAELDAATATFAAARANGNAASPELGVAGQRYLNAKSAMQKIINDAAVDDPRATEAKRAVATAEDELRAAREDLFNSTNAGSR